MANEIFRFYADDPDFVFSYLRKNWREVVLRWDGRKVGSSNIWLMVIALDESAAAAAFQEWLGRYGTAGDLVIRNWPFRPIMTVPNTIVIRRRWRFSNWLQHRAQPTGILP
ncbi:MAG: hypothetical protein J0I79_33710 [Mesorhizobium sp.]|uniref:hypothetical protein n=1 Tax=Mesorhizobium sp. TaxID=1871066 RepID=UPI001AC7D16C|nr:hypothetical protein [Mesorhizobium sp.]MBN9222915.1 hypothetical protein [Mesorhizobium sp.]